MKNLCPDAHRNQALYFHLANKGSVLASSELSPVDNNPTHYRTTENNYFWYTIYQKLPYLVNRDSKSK